MSNGADTLSVAGPRPWRDRRFIGAHDAGDQSVAHHVAIGEAGDVHALDPVEQIERLDQAGAFAARQVDLASDRR